ncbi:hypothetical protein E2562_019475 [Oryza meyeriana var. granulata]|uniref:DNA/RNA-binding protein Alba-like domain-containing protein n=2 Tax=Magnoliopsida TaxID=3398 RepID=A0A6G1DJ92_9ORYZ|nr:hypothetical protein E2562_019475 [Oryza meyeriana var. granulata]
MDRYQRVEKPRSEAAAISENEIRITTQGLIRNYVTYATSLLQEKRVKEIVLKAMGQAISKTVAIAEIIKKRIPGLHQDTSISSVSITDVWEPIEEGLVPLEMTRHVSMISISLSPKELNKSIKLPCMQSHLSRKDTNKLSNINNNSNSLGQIKFKQIHMVEVAVEAEEEEGVGVVGEGMVEGMVDMITTKEVMADMDTRVDMDTKEDMATREGMATTKVAMEGMVTTKVDTEDMKMVAGTTIGTEVVVVAAEEEATGDTAVRDMNVQVQHMNAVAEVEVAQAAEDMLGAVDEWVAAVGGLVEKDLDASIAWFWKAINSGDKVDSALKDMAVVMKQRGYLAEAIDAIKSLRHLCPKQSQESLDNILLDLYKASGRTKEEIELLKQKLRKIYLGEAFHGKTTKRARSHGRKIHVSVKQETSRVLGNLAWAYMQQRNFMAAEVVYRKAQMIDPDANKACNLALCLIEQRRLADAEAVLADVLAGRYHGDDDHHQPQHGGKIVTKVEELMARISGEVEGRGRCSDEERGVEDEMMELLDVVVRQWAAQYRRSNRRLPVFEEITPVCREQMAAC